MKSNERYFLEGFERVVRVLEVLRRGGKPLRLSHISSLVDLPTTSTYRIMRTLEQLEFIVRDVDTRRYWLGPRLLDFGLAVLNSLEPRHVALPYMEHLAELTGETVNFSFLIGSRAILAEVVEGTHVLAVRRRVGHSFPPHVSSVGKVLLADLTEDKVRRLLGEGPLEALTEKTKTSIADLLKELEMVRQVGYAMNDEESTTGLRAVGAPVRDMRGRVVAALSVIGPTMRVSDDRLSMEWPHLVVSTAEAISRALGHRQPASNATDPSQGSPNARLRA